MHQVITVVRWRTEGSPRGELVLSFVRALLFPHRRCSAGRVLARSDRRPRHASLLLVPFHVTAMTQNHEVGQGVKPAIAELLHVVDLEAEPVAATLGLAGMPGAVQHLLPDRGRDGTAPGRTRPDANDGLLDRGRSRDGCMRSGYRRASPRGRTTAATRPPGLPRGPELVEHPHQAFLVGQVLVAGLP